MVSFVVGVIEVVPETSIRRRPPAWVCGLRVRRMSFSVTGGELQRARTEGLPVVLLDFVVNLLSMDRDFVGRLNAELDDVTLEANDLHGDTPINDDAFTRFAR